jgi:hypothetical protein
VTLTELDSLDVAEREGEFGVSLALEAAPLRDRGLPGTSVDAIGKSLLTRQALTKMFEQW